MILIRVLSGSAVVTKVVTATVLSPLPLCALRTPRFASPAGVIAGGTSRARCRVCRRPVMLGARGRARRVLRASGSRRAVVAQLHFGLVRVCHAGPACNARQRSRAAGRAPPVVPGVALVTLPLVGVFAVRGLRAPRPAPTESSCRAKVVRVGALVLATIGTRIDERSPAVRARVGARAGAPRQEEQGGREERGGQLVARRHPLDTVHGVKCVTKD